MRASGPCVRQNRVVLAVVATVKLSRRWKPAQPGGLLRIFAKRGRPEGTRLPGEHGISRQPTVQGRPCVWLHLYAAVQFLLRYQRTADRGCQPAPGLPCALLAQEGGELKQSSGELSREMRRCARLKMDGSLQRTLNHHRHPEVRAQGHNSAPMASPRRATAASRPFILRGSRWGAPRPITRASG